MTIDLNNRLKRWQTTDAFIATCKVLSALSSAKEELGHTNRIDFSIEDINTFQDLLIEEGYSIQRIHSFHIQKREQTS